MGGEFAVLPGGEVAGGAGGGRAGLKPAPAGEDRALAQDGDGEGRRAVLVGVDCWLIRCKRAVCILIVLRGTSAKCRWMLWHSTSSGCKVLIVRMR